MSKESPNANLLTKLNKRAYLAIVGFAFLIVLVFLASLFSVTIAGTFGLVATSLGLIIATIRLKNATDNLVSATFELSRNQILPRISLQYSSWWEEKQFLSFAIRNVGVGTAYGAKAFGTNATGVRFEIEPESKMDDLLIGENIRYVVNLEPKAYREFKADFDYADAKGYEYKQSIVIPKETVVTRARHDEDMVA